jgi:hypothetical protein
MSIPVVVLSGFNPAETSLGTISVTPNEIHAACDAFGSQYILRMNLHYQRYVITHYLPSHPVVHGIYLAANPAASLTMKKRANSVTGNIGESILGIVARRKLGATSMHDVLPLNVNPKAKCPDFRIRINPSYPTEFGTATGLTLTPGFQYWPAESKAVESSAKATNVVKRALSQLGTFWYQRRHLEPNVAGFGIVCCFIYKGTKANPLQVIRLYVFVPTNQNVIHQRIDHFRSTNNRDGFLSELGTGGSPTRSSLKDG